MRPQLTRRLSRQGLIGLGNRRVVRNAEIWNAVFDDVDSALHVAADVVCACGRDACDAKIRVSVEEYRFVREKPYRFVLARDHATRWDDVVVRTDRYDVVEVKPRHRRFVTEQYPQLGDFANP